MANGNGNGSVVKVVAAIAGPLVVAAVVWLWSQTVALGQQATRAETRAEAVRVELDVMRSQWRADVVDIKADVRSIRDALQQRGHGGR